MKRVPLPMNYYELFSLPFSPKVDKKLLSEKYFQLQMQHHPDFFTQRSDEEKEESLQVSSDINKAYAIFQNEEKTIEYFLQQKGSIETDEKYELAPEFLMQMMEVNESLLEKDGVTLATELAAIETSIFDDVRSSLQAENFEETPQAIEKLKAYHYKKKYLNRILERLGD